MSGGYGRREPAGRGPGGPAGRSPGYPESGRFSAGEPSRETETIPVGYDNLNERQQARWRELMGQSFADWPPELIGFINTEWAIYRGHRGPLTDDERGLAIATWVQRTTRL